MRILAPVFAAITLFAVIACTGGPTEPVPDIDATVEARVRGTLEAEVPIAATPVSTGGSTPTAPPTPRRRLFSTERLSLAQYADKYANGPGAIYVGDLAQLTGPAPTPDQGDFEGNVPMWALENHLWLYESDYYQELLHKANLTNPTPSTSLGEKIVILHACINRALFPCRLLESFFTPNLLNRTGGQVAFIVTSFNELWIPGSYTLDRVTDGTLDSATVYGGYVSGEIPSMEIQNLLGIYSHREHEFEATQSIIKDIENLVLAETGGVVMNHSWFAGYDLFFFCREKIDTPDDFMGKRMRSFSTALSDWIEGMGADVMWLGYGDTYTLLERGIHDCGVTGGNAAYGQKWYEVTNYMIGPLVSFPFVNNVINAETWTSIPNDLQQILLEEAAKSELEALRLAAIQNDLALQRNIDAGLEFVEFSLEIRATSFRVARESVIPGWLRRLSYPGRSQDVVDLFNSKIGPIVGLRIEPDGSVAQVPITQGPHTGKTMEQVLAE